MTLKALTRTQHQNVLKGSGLSSSAAFEVLVGTIINGLFANNEVNPIEIAKFGQFAENVYYNKPSGLVDQMASLSARWLLILRATEEPIVEKVEFDLKKHNHALCIIDSGADHADLTDEYATIPSDMKELRDFSVRNFCVKLMKMSLWRISKTFVQNLIMTEQYLCNPFL